MDQRQYSRLILLLAGVFVALGAWGGVFDELERIGKPRRLEGQRTFLPPEQAFRIQERLGSGRELAFDFTIEPGYYLYRDKLAITALSPGAVLGGARLPDAEMKDDPEFGLVPVYKHDFTMTVPLEKGPDGAVTVEVQLSFQGCAEDGICYPPMRRQFAVPIPGPPAVPGGGVMLSETERIAQQIGERSLALTMLIFLGLGLLLSFTPCVLPMVPILSGIIVGQQQPLSTGRAVLLSTAYVLAMAATYAMAGIVAGLLGHNLQAAFQRPALIAAFAGLFGVLALSMFGLFELQLPAAVRARLDRFSRGQRGGSYPGVMAMGVLSAVLVGPCVAPPLAGALTYIGQTGSGLVGGAALFALGLGMGLPLIAIGGSAGALLPRVGPWMEGVKQVFGVVFLGVAVWFLERIVPPTVALMLWAALLIGSAVFLGALARTPAAASAWLRLRQALGVFLLIYGGLLIVGASSGATDVFAPLETWTRTRSEPAPELNFVPVKTLADLDRAVSRAQQEGRVAMLDVYADWCVECKHLERETFVEASVHRRLSNMLLLRADVTANDDEDRALLSSHALYGPPALLFFREGDELRQQRVVGFVAAPAFAQLLDTLAVR